MCDTELWAESLETVASYLLRESTHQREMLQVMMAVQNHEEPPQTENFPANFAGWLSNPVGTRKTVTQRQEISKSDDWTDTLHVPENTYLVLRLDGTIHVPNTLDHLAVIPQGSSLTVNGGCIEIDNPIQESLFMVDDAHGIGVSGVRLSNVEIKIAKEVPAVVVSNAAMAHIIFHDATFTSTTKGKTFPPKIVRPREDLVFISSTCAFKV